MFKVISKIIGFISQGIAAFGISMGVLLAFVNVVARYVFDKSFTWASELTIYLFLWSIFFGVVYCFKEDAHISINILLEKIPKKGAKVLMILSSTITLVFLISVAYYGYEYLKLVIELDERSIDLEISMWIPYLVIPIAFSFSSYRVMEKLVKIIRTTFNMLKTVNEGDELLDKNLIKAVEKKTGGLL